MQNLFDKASLVMVPSGYDNGKLYNIKPEDKGSAFEFERATMATRVNSSGLIETMFPEATNLLLQSNQFDTTWTGNTNLLNNQIGYDGLSNAWLSTFVSFPDIIRQTNTDSGVQTLSIYAKGNINNGIRLYAFGTLNCQAFFNLNNGTVANTNNVINATIEDKGNGWYRCAMTFNQTNSSIYVYLSNNSNQNATSGSVYIQDAQLEAGYFATPYIDTTTQTVTRKNQANQPRIDYTSGEGALLLEPVRTNYTPYSEDFTKWTRGGGQQYVTSNYAISPDGTQNADRILFTGANQEVAFNDASISGATVGSIYIKGTSGETIRFGVNDSNVPTHTLDGTWQRVEAIRSTTGGVRLTVNTYGGVTARDVLVWGAQLELGSYPTSYIPTNGQQETRASENIEKRNLTSSLLNQSEGSFYLELQAASTDAGRFVITSYPDGTSDDTIRFIFSSNIQFQLVSSGTQISESTNPSTQRVKVIGTYSGSELKLCVNGGAVQKLSGNFSFANQPTRIFAHAFVDTIRFFGDVYELHYFPEALTDEELQRLTSPSADATTFTELANNNGYTIL